MRESYEVASSRKMSMAADKTEIEKELSDLKREVIEARNLVIKTDNLLKNLHAEVKTVGKRQDDFQKRQWVSSGAAYIGFAVICVMGAIAISSARASSANSERERLEKQVAEITAATEKQRTDVAAVSAAQRQAAEVYKLMTTLPGDERLKGVDALVKLDTSKLSTLERQALNDRADLLRREIGQAAFERGKTAFRRNEMENTVKELSRFVAMNPDQPDLLDASFFLGVAHNQLRNHAEAARLLTQFVEQDKRAKTRDYAMLLLAHSLQETQQLDKAADMCRAGIAEYPNSQFASQFRGRLATVKRLAAGEPATPAVLPAVAPAQPAPVQPAAQ